MKTFNFVPLSPRSFQRAHKSLFIFIAESVALPFGESNLSNCPSKDLLPAPRSQEDAMEAAVVLLQRLGYNRNLRESGQWETLSPDAQERVFIVLQALEEVNGNSVLFS